MDLERQVAQAIRSELERQQSEGGLKLERGGEAKLRLSGDLDLEALAMAVVGAVAGGP